MEETAFDIIVDVEFFPSSEGGRRGPTLDNRFHCIFEINGEFFDCRLFLNDIGPIWPGTRATVPIKFLSPELVRPKLFVGEEFYLKEIGRIASGRIKKIN